MGAGVGEQYGMTPFTPTDQQPQGQRNAGEGKHQQVLQTERGSELFSGQKSKWEADLGTIPTEVIIGQWEVTRKLPQEKGWKIKGSGTHSWMVTSVRGMEKQGSVVVDNYPKRLEKAAGSVQQQGGLCCAEKQVTRREERCKAGGQIDIQPIHFIINNLVINFKREVGNV